MDRKIGLVLSGGGARGIVHVGVLQALEDLGLKIHALAGASAGAMAGTYYAAGYTPQEMMKIVSNTGYLRLFKLALMSPGFIKPNYIMNFHKKYLPEDSFEVLDKKMFVTVANMNESRTEYISQGELILPLVASTAIPLMFSPVKIKGQDYLDGGILNNFPVEPLEEMCDVLIGVDVNPPVPYRKKLSSKFDVMERTFYLTLCAQTYYRAKRVDYLIAPAEVSRYGLFDVQSSKKLYQLGYNETMKVMSNSRLLGY